jgi:predicted ATPase
MPHLQTVHLPTIPPEDAARFPFCVPTVVALQAQPLDLNRAVTFFIGENGSGKSTLLEALASAAEMITVGSEDGPRDTTLTAVRQLAKQLKLIWNRRTRRGFFLRAEDFFGYTKRIQAIREYAEAELRTIDADTDLSDLARSQVRLPHVSTIHGITSRYGTGLDSVSHGESFFRLFHSRFVPNGLYLLDEPEAPLSPMRQVGFLSLIKQMVEEQGAQFIIATHSPILMAFPQAQIYSFDHGTIQAVAYNQIEHVTLTRDFLNNPERFLRHL